MENLFQTIYKGKTVLITGHTGFKGSWLALWLSKMGAHVVGYSLEAPTQPNHFTLLTLDIVSIIGDILDKNHLQSVFDEYKPDIVFHLAAQALVRDSYAQPAKTFETNVMGTVNVLDCCRISNVKAIVNVTSDKCYHNSEQIWGYREIDPLGGRDPYSASKGAAELVGQSYRASFFNVESYGTTHSTLLADVRAGNVIGGGDWAKDRLIPDIIRSIQKSESVTIRSPKSTRPWQHVLEPLSGYLQIGWRLLEGKKEFADNWNFGPTDEAILTVADVLEHIKRFIPELNYTIEENPNNPHEAGLLQLDSTKARKVLNWRNIWNSSTTFEKTASWYKEQFTTGALLSEDNLQSYISDAMKAGAIWVNQ